MRQKRVQICSIVLFDLVPSCQVSRCPPLRCGAVLSGLAMSTLAIWCRFVRSRDVHPCDVVPLCQVSRCPPLRYGAVLSGLAMSGLAISAPPFYLLSPAIADTNKINEKILDV